MSLSVTGSALVMTAATIMVVSAAGLPHGWNAGPVVAWALFAGGLACGVMTIAIGGLGGGRPRRRGRPGPGWRGAAGTVPARPAAAAAAPAVPGEVLSAGEGPGEDWFRGIRPGGQPPGRPG